MKRNATENLSFKIEKDVLFHEIELHFLDSRSLLNYYKLNLTFMLQHFENIVNCIHHDFQFLTRIWVWLVFNICMCNETKCMLNTILKCIFCDQLLWLSCSDTSYPSLYLKCNAICVFKRRYWNIYICVLVSCKFLITVIFLFCI